MIYQEKTNPHFGVEHEANRAIMSDLVWQILLQ